MRLACPTGGSCLLDVSLYRYALRYPSWSRGIWSGCRLCSGVVMVSCLKVDMEAHVGRYLSLAGGIGAVPMRAEKQVGGGSRAPASWR